MPVQDRFETYAMRIEELSQQEHKWLDVDQVGEQLGMSPLESRKLADLLVDEGWATTMILADRLKLRLIKRGFDGIAKLRWPPWRRWLDRNPKIETAIVGVVAGVVGGVILGLLKQLF